MFEDIVQSIYSFVWGPPVIFGIFAFHIFATIRTRFIQRKIFTAIKLSFARRSEGEGEISPFQALCSSLSATVGPANIVGIPTAIITGGPGAVLLFWISGFFAMATRYMESFVGVRYRVKTNRGGFLGGPMISWIRALGNRSKRMHALAYFMSMFFSIV